MTTEIIMNLSNLKNMPLFANRLQCYENAFRNSDEILVSNPRIIQSDWVIQFVKDVFDNLDNKNAEQWCYRQFSRLFIDLNFEISPNTKTGATIHDKLSPWLLKEGLQIVKKHLQSSRPAPDVCIKAMCAWGIAIKILGQQTMQSSEKTNLIVSIFPHAIRSPNLDVVTEAFRSWKMLVKVFATDPNWQSITDAAFERGNRITSRLELIVKALKFASDKNLTRTAPAVFDCWWYCCISLGPRLAHHFEEVAHGLLRYCVGGATEYRSLNDQIDVIIRSISCPLGITLISLMNKKLDNKSSYIRTSEIQSLWPRLLDVLESIISKPGTSVFDNAAIIKDHALYALQCVRFCDQKCTNDIDARTNERIPKLFLDIVSKILKSSLPPIDRTLQLALFLAQFTAWLHETTISADYLASCITEFESLNVFEQIDNSDNLQVYAKYTNEFKEKLEEIKKKIMPIVEDHLHVPEMEASGVELEASIAKNADEIEESINLEELDQTQPETRKNPSTNKSTSSSISSMSSSTTSANSSLETTHQSNTGTALHEQSITEQQQIVTDKEKLAMVIEPMAQVQIIAPVVVQEPEEVDNADIEQEMEQNYGEGPKSPQVVQMPTNSDADKDNEEGPNTAAGIEQEIEQKKEGLKSPQIESLPSSSDENERQLTIIEDDEDEEKKNMEEDEKATQENKSPAKDNSMGAIANASTATAKEISLSEQQTLSLNEKETSDEIETAKETSVETRIEAAMEVSIDKDQQDDEGKEEQKSTPIKHMSKLNGTSDEVDEKEAPIADTKEKETESMNSRFQVTPVVDKAKQNAEEGGSNHLNGTSSTCKPSSSIPVPTTPRSQRTNTSIFLRSTSTPSGSAAKPILRKADSPAAKKNHRVQFNVDYDQKEPQSLPTLGTPTKNLRSSPYPSHKRQIDDSTEESSNNMQGGLLDVTGPSPAKQRAMNAFGREWPIRQPTKPTIVAPHRGGRRGRPRKILQSPIGTVLTPPSPLKCDPSMSSSSLPPTPSKIRPSEMLPNEQKQEEQVEAAGKIKGEEQLKALSNRMETIMDRTMERMEAEVDEMKRQMMGKFTQIWADSKRELLEMLHE